MKAIGIILIVSAVVLISLTLKISLIKRERALNEAEMFCLFCFNEISALKTEKEKLFKKAYKSHEYAFFLSNEADKYLKSDEKQAKEELLELIGKSNTDSQLKAIGVFKERFGEMKHIAEKDGREKGRLYISLGASLSLFAVVVLI